MDEELIEFEDWEEFFSCDIEDMLPEIRVVVLKNTNMSPKDVVKKYIGYRKKCFPSAYVRHSNGENYYFITKWLPELKGIWVSKWEF